MSDDRLNDFETRLVALKQDAERLIEAMQAESEQARQALTLYGRTRRLLSLFMGRAASHQGKACHLGRRLSACRDQFLALQREYDGLAWDLSEQDAKGLRTARRELRWIGEQVRSWSVESDGLQ